MWRKALLVGRWLLPYIRGAAPIALILGVIALLVATWWLGPRWSINGEYPFAAWQMRALVTLAAVLLVAMVWGIVLARRLRKVNLEKADKQRQQEDPILPMERKQQRLLDRQLAALKSNLPGRKGLYRLPWYLVIGLEDSGKTSLIQRAGQTYTLTNVTRNSRTDRNPFGFDWWIGDDGVLIDPDGELLSQKQGQGESPEVQQRLWQHFMSWLECNRPQRPLNGVVVTVDLAELSMLGEREREDQAILLRTRLRELMDQLGSRLPVYVSFTKMDLLYGFAPFARSLDKEEKDQAMGFTFTIGNRSDQDHWLNEFSERFTLLVEGLGDRLPKILANTRDAEERVAVYSFTRQMAGLRPVLEQYLMQLLSADAFSTPALVRGTYFTSVLQEGVPEDAFVSAAAANYRMVGPIQPAQRSGKSLSLFTRNLFPGIIYREAGLAGDNRRVVQRRQNRIVMASVVAICAGAGMIAGWQHYFIRNAEAATEVEARVRAFVDDWPPVGVEPDSSGRNLLEPLDELREATLAFGGYREEWPMVAQMGLYQGRRIGPKVEASYLNMLSYQYLPAIMLGVMSEMSKASHESHERLEHLRVLRMLYDGSGRRENIVTRYMRVYWQRHFPGQRNVQKRLMNHLQYAMAHTDLARMAEGGDETADMVLAPFRSTVRWAQNELGRVSTSDRVYRDLEASADQQFKAPLDLARASGPAFSSSFRAAVESGKSASDDFRTTNPLLIPALFTREGLNKWFFGQSRSATELALIDAWVLGRRDDVHFSDADEAELLAQLQTRYAKHYIDAWRGALSHFTVRRFQDLNHGVRILESLSSGDRPLARLLKQVRDNTVFIPQTGDETEASRNILEQSPHFRMLNDIQRQFSDLNQLTRKVVDQPSGLEQITRVINDLHQYLRNIQESPGVGKAALAAARARLSLQGADPIFTLQRIADNQPEPLKRILHRVANESWRVVLDQAVAQLEREWYRNVFQPFQQSLAGRYPFNPDATENVTLEDFERFFGSDGILQTFYENKLKLFLEEYPEQVGHARKTNLVRHDVLKALDRAKRIRSAYFTLSGNLDVEFALEPLNLSANKRRSVVNVDGQLVEFSHGPRQSIPLVWPNTLRDTVESRITLVPIQINRSPRSLSENGPWALFRLLDRADITGVSDSAVDVRFRVDDGEMRYRLHAASNINPFTQKLLAGYRLPRSLY
ncbi:type VI secretion protein IcmF [Marinobacter santoriniensis NKSG1]|uniref:Type VI secretion protein IcmF n=1 Tax=Marinobacter santoriniensis NKSG1 TaxID=1288826 RepID=M7CP35_9GAMM|nr:type VI secretion protein IcmF [Marinobacter santoriniensis NKSG1]